MNSAYAPHAVSFNLIDTDFTVNSNWAAGNGELAMKTSLRQGTYSDLNVYFVDTPKLGGSVALGYCHFPEPGVTTGSTTFKKDGCVIESETVPGGSETEFDLGGTAVHEVSYTNVVARIIYLLPVDWSLVQPFPHLPGWLHRW